MLSFIFGSVCVQEHHSNKGASSHHVLPQLIRKRNNSSRSFLVTIDIIRFIHSFDDSNYAARQLGFCSLKAQFIVHHFIRYVYLAFVFQNIINHNGNLPSYCFSHSKHTVITEIQIIVADISITGIALSSRAGC